MGADDTSRRCGCDLTGMAPPAIHLVDGHPDPADDTSRDALVERVARTWYDSQGFHAADSWGAETRLNRDANYMPHAEAVVDTVVMPLVDNSHADADCIRDRSRTERDAAIERAEAAEAAHQGLTDAVRGLANAMVSTGDGRWRYELRSILEAHGATNQREEQS